jgi:hypothetical protein
LKQNPDLLTEETIQVLTDWCLSEEVDNVSMLASYVRHRRERKGKERKGKETYA